MVYGGGSAGLGGAVSRAVLSNQGNVTAVIPKVWENDDDVVKDEPGVTREIVEGMDQRKARISELANGFVALPGGLGTLEEVHCRYY
jgi:predicted Rossmann-fold nucleotide-binding protein